MRTETEMMQLILSVAKKEAHILAVYMNGSRTNPNVVKDIFQDYDIVYLVDNMEYYLQDSTWIDVFGERIIMQMPEAMTLYPGTLGHRFTYLMQFTDGNRIDLSLIPWEERMDYMKEDKLIQKIWDKTGTLPELDAASDIDYHIKRPNCAHYQDCINEFYWVATYVAKGLWRNEFLYAVDHLFNNVRGCLLQMLTWKIGMETDFSCSVGKNYKFLQPYVSPLIWQKLLAAHQLSSISDIWQSLFALITLFEDIAIEVGQILNVPYPRELAEKVQQYLHDIHALPAQATDMNL